MKKRRVKKKTSFKLIKFLKISLFLLCLYISYQITLYALTINNLDISNEQFLSAMINNTNHHIIYKNNGIIGGIVNLITNVNIKNPVNILKDNLTNYTSIDNTELVYSDNDGKLEDLEKITEYIKDPNPVSVLKPTVYIYNTHQLENYSTASLELYNIKPNVMMASYLLKEKLNKLDIKAIAEETNVTEILRVNNWEYGSSYKVSRMLIKDAKEKNPSLDFYIDIHRDAIKKKESTITINGVTYAKILFVVGLENPTYEKNLKLTKEINSLIDKKYPGLSRGIYTKKGKGVNGVYNQDFSPNMILLECGGYENTIEEVKATIEAFAGILKEYLG